MTSPAAPRPIETPHDAAAWPLLGAAVETQDALLVVDNDLERLQRLLGDAGRTLMANFVEASARLRALPADAPAPALRDALDGVDARLRASIAALQFQDMSSQLIDHVQRRLRHCADRLAADAMGGDDALVAAEPLRPNPVTQDEMDGGSVELF